MTFDEVNRLLVQVSTLLDCHAVHLLTETKQAELAGQLEEARQYLRQHRRLWQERGKLLADLTGEEEARSTLDN